MNNGMTSAGGIAAAATGELGSTDPSLTEEKPVYQESHHIDEAEGEDGYELQLVAGYGNGAAAAGAAAVVPKRANAKHPIHCSLRPITKIKKPSEGGGAQTGGKLPAGGLKPCKPKQTPRDYCYNKTKRAPLPIITSCELVRHHPHLILTPPLVLTSPLILTLSLLPTFPLNRHPLSF